MSRQEANGSNQRVLHVVGEPAVAELHKQHEARLPFDKGRDGGSALLAQQQVTLPVSCHRTILDLRWPVADEDHVLQAPRAPRLWTKSD